MQGHYSLLYREEEREMIKFCRETGVALCPWGPLAQGMLARPYRVRGSTARSAATAADPSNSRKEAQETIKRVEELAEKKGWTMSQVALAWTLKRVTSPIIGFSSVERMEEALSARGKELTEEEEKYLEELYTPCEVEGHE
jgi:aryl-alcohol dehydrogenase-like predicted oxidoreductase